MKKAIALLLCLAMLLPVVSVTAEEGYTTLYTEDGRTEQFSDEMVEAQLTVGWYREPVQRLYTEGKSEVFPSSKVEEQLLSGWYEEAVQRLYTESESEVFPVTKVEALLAEGWYEEPVQRLYAEDKSALFPASKVEAQLTVGWYEETVQRLYAEGKSKLFPVSKVEAQLTVGWYTEPVQRLYAAGKSKLFPKSQVAAQLAVGWYESSKKTLYSLDGRTTSVDLDKVEANQKKGWYTEPVVKVYASGKRSMIIPLRQVADHQEVGWYPLHKFMFVARKGELEDQFGKLYYLGYYPGNPQSGTVPRMKYNNSEKSSIYIPFIDFENQYDCVWVGLKIADVFPYLKLNADKNGRISVDKVAEMLSDAGIYGKTFRAKSPLNYTFTSYSAPYVSGSSCYMDYDYTRLVWGLDKDGYINVNGMCNFSILK